MMATKKHKPSAAQWARKGSGKKREKAKARAKTTKEQHDRETAVRRSLLQTAENAELAQALAFVLHPRTRPDRGLIPQCEGEGEK